MFTDKERFFLIVLLGYVMRFLNAGDLVRTWWDHMSRTMHACHVIPGGAGPPRNKSHLCADTSSSTSVLGAASEFPACVASRPSNRQQRTTDGGVRLKQGFVELKMAESEHWVSEVPPQVVDGDTEGGGAAEGSLQELATTLTGEAGQAVEQGALDGVEENAADTTDTGVANSQDDQGLAHDGEPTVEASSGTPPQDERDGAGAVAESRDEDESQHPQTAVDGGTAQQAGGSDEAAAEQSEPDGGAEPFEAGEAAKEDTLAGREPTLAHSAGKEEGAAQADPCAAVIVRLLPLEQHLKLQPRFGQSDPVLGVRQLLAKQLGVPPESVLLQASGSPLTDDTILQACPQDADGNVAIDAEVACNAAPGVDLLVPGAGTQQQVVVCT
jgi:hypothetical protein